MTQRAADNTIVVGVDGSEASMEALRWATRQASALQADVVAVHAWQPIGAGFAPYAPSSARPTAAEQQQRAAQLLAETLRAVFGPQVGSAVRAVVVEGQPERVLVQQAHGALLLALGRTAHRQHDLPSMGSVGRACLRHATVPVVAVPAAERSARPVSPPGAIGAPAFARSGAA
ncbi:universal stress protein [Streptomyces sp. ID05-04B]|uniref:universal stress protein n=1 Tax=unclassified Streptomyces TaxID=2593676 RepID=UPI00131F180B|nr:MULTISPECIES: universal stress protein [unclassified Streptomyces]MDX5568250.1 universal stress protein [Streptomyces sp. ID05-04B]